MNPYGNNANAHGAGQLGYSEEPPGPSISNSMPDLVSDPGHDHLLYGGSMALPMASFQLDTVLYDLESLPEFGEFEVLDYPDSSLFGSQTDTDLECDRGSSISMVSSLDSAYSCPTITSTPEQQYEDPEGLANLGTDSVDGLGSWLPAAPQFPACGDRREHLLSMDGGSRVSFCQAKPVLAAKIAAIENNGHFNVEGCADVEVRRLVETRSGRCGCQDHRLTSREVSARQMDRFKGVKMKKDTSKWTCEIRISTKIPKDIELSKGKLWLGTFATRNQAAKALDVGRYLLSVKKFNAPPDNFFQIDSQTLQELEKFKGYLHAQPLTTKHLQLVKKIAEHYCKHDSLQGFLL